MSANKYAYMLKACDDDIHIKRTLQADTKTGGYLWQVLEGQIEIILEARANYERELNLAVEADKRREVNK